ncbi:hypothetical protein TO73_1883 [Thermus aquaticus Y51MC23]|uniref:Uncharacterized protein n=1 Tax=Thermus aquaticus (strain ATCC BAA-2747 / Y51MC23) TaxID=498848 RepID=A0ABM5VND4_THEA5|nr:hypothetical protein TO73_1883 [Thermus aquaticus Y51MC23]
MARLEVGPSPYHLPILAPALLRVLVVRRFRPQVPALWFCNTECSSWG